MSRLEAATDGSADNPAWGTGGWAWVTAEGTWWWGNHPETTNNRMELTAVLKLLVSHPDRPLMIRTDSTYVLNIFTDLLNGWGRKDTRTAKGTQLKNLDLIKQIDELLDERERSLGMGPKPDRWKWVRGHSRDPLNESADRLAGFARWQGKLGHWRC